MEVQQAPPTSRRASARRASIIEDAAILEQLGHKQELKRNFSMISMLGLAFAILNTWTALAASITLALPSGGSSAVIWGLMVAGVLNLCLAASLGEFLSAYPTAGGQYHWVAIIAWKRWSRSLSYITGWINVSGWVALTATTGLLGSTFIINIISLMHPNYEPQPWHQFLIYIGFTLAALVVNAFMTRLLPIVTQAGFLWSVAGFVIISITILACSSGDYQSGEFVYAKFSNEVGWPDGVAWMLGLLQGAFGLTGFDAVAHMIEEIPDAQRQGPKIMIYCILIGMFTGFIFLTCLLLVTKDIDTLISAKWGPLLQVFMDATNSKAGSVCLLLFPIVCMLFTAITIMCTSSRMSYAFARDHGMPFSRTFAKVHPTLDVPLNALLWTAAWVIIFGCIFLGSSSTFNAITSASVVALGVTYAIPPAINVLRGRRMLPEDRPFKIPEPWGWIFNIVGILWSILTTVLFVFPPELPVTGSNMNYAIAAFGVILLIAGGTWIFDGRKNYHGPQINVQALTHGEIEGVDGVDVAEEKAEHSPSNAKEEWAAEASFTTLRQVFAIPTSSHNSIPPSAAMQQRGRDAFSRLRIEAPAASQPNDPFDTFPLDTMYHLAEYVSFLDLLSLARTCKGLNKSLRPCLRHKAREADLGELLQHLTTLSRNALDTWVCSHCKVLHPVNYQDTPHRVATGAGCGMMNTLRCSGPADAGYLVDHHHIQLTLKYCRDNPVPLREGQRKYREKLLAPHVKVDFRTHLVGENRLRVKYTVEPRVFRGHYIQKCVWQFLPITERVNRRAMGVVYVCPHQCFLPSQHSTQIFRNRLSWALSMTLVNQRCNSDYCEYCATEFEVRPSEVGDGIEIIAWRDLGEEGTIFDTTFREAIGQIFRLGKQSRDNYFRHDGPRMLYGDELPPDLV